MAYPKLTPITATGATEPRYLGDRCADVVNVRDYGAKGDGTTDDTAAFQAAASAADGRAIFVPQGRYAVLENVSGFFYTDGTVDTGGRIPMFSIQDVQEHSLLLKVATIARPSSSFTANYSQQDISGYGFQGCCYDTKREVFYFGLHNNSDDEQPGYIFTLSDILDSSTITETESVDGGHFNCLAYDETNDKIWIAPGSAKTGYVVLVDPETFATEALALESGVDYYQLAIDNEHGFVYLNESGSIVRYYLSNSTKDETFTPMPRKEPTIQADERLVDQSMFFYDGILFFTHIINSSYSGVMYKKHVFTCYDIKTKKSVHVAHRLPSIVEIQQCVIKGGILYMPATTYQFEGLLTIYTSSLDTIETTGFGLKNLPSGTNLNNVLGEGEYVIPDGTTFNTYSNTPNTKGGCGNVFVKNLCAGPLQSEQTIRNTRGEEAFRILTNGVEKIGWQKSRGDFCIVKNNTASANDFLGSGTYYWSNNITGTPDNSTGMIKTIVAKFDNSNQFFVRQIFFKQGTPGSTDFYLFHRTGYRLGENDPVSFSPWYQIYTNKDYYNNSLIPQTDNTYSLGNSSRKWSQLYANTATINTSDETIKDNIKYPGDSLMRAWGKVNFKVFQFKDSIEKKGENARIHVGVIAQEVSEAFKSEGLDANRYGLFCYDEWPDSYEEETVIDEEPVFDEEGKEIKPMVTHVERKLVQKAGSIFGIRYEEALALECAYLRSCIVKMQGQIDTLVERLNQLTNNTNN